MVHIRKKLNRGVGLLIVLFLISGCSKGNITFLDAEEMNYDVSFDLCSLVTQIDGQGVNSLLVNNSTIQLDSKTVECNTTNVSIIPNEPMEINFLYSGKTFIKKITFIEEKEPETEKDIVEESPQSKNDEDVAESAVQEASEQSGVVEEKETTSPNNENKPKVEVKPKETTKPKPETKPSQNGAYKKFLSSETVTHAQAQANCVAYASQFNNFTGCRKLFDEKTNLIIGFEPY